MEAEKTFTLLPAGFTGIEFRNELPDDPAFDIFRYRNYFNGGGVAIGDINNDGLEDIYLTANSGSNRLYLNKGDFAFEDITGKAGVAGKRAWSTGVSMADVNGDGWLDIYVCNSGNVEGDDKENELYINNGDGTFTEKGELLGIADKGCSTHAVFFDFDQDGDLDLYVLNNSFLPVSNFGLRNIRHERDSAGGGDKLYRNDDGYFVDISEVAGIYGSATGFGLGVTVGDVNEDGWADIYISNDFFERDFLYLNNQDGTFSEKLTTSMGHISMFSMGADMADLDNDGYPEIFVTDMLPEEDRRFKMNTYFESYNTYQTKLKNDYYHQYMRNMLHKNNGDGTFSEIGQFAGVDKTDWSWGALLADFDNDGKKDIFVSNGVFQDVTDQDFVSYLSDEISLRATMLGEEIDFKELSKKMSSTKVKNYMFAQQGEYFSFKNVTAAWGLDEPSFSNGAAYGDLDNDGDLDLVINNVNQELFVYRNESASRSENHFLRISFKGLDKNVYGLGAKVKAYLENEILAYEHMPMRGFQSSMGYTMLVGLGKASSVDSLVVSWPGGASQTLYNVKSDQDLSLWQESAAQTPIHKRKAALAGLFTDITPATGLRHRHRENPYVDFNRYRMLYHMLSTEGPALAVGDVNQDGMDDFYIGGAQGESGKIYLQQPGQTFIELPTSPFEQDKASEDVDALFFDADNDGDLDLYVVSGGNEFSASAAPLQDRFYINKGRGAKGIPIFEKAPEQLPLLLQSGSCVKAADYDQDGDLDLFVGTRLLPEQYGIPADQYILQNNGKGYFTEASASVAPELKQLGLVTDAAWADYDQDGILDLLIVGEWMPVTLFRNNGKTFEKIDKPEGLEQSEGWWNTIEAGDLDGDGDLDFVLGNLGRNSRLQASEKAPLSMYVSDFDDNGIVEQIFTYQQEGKEYPMALRHDIVSQLTYLKKKHLYYKDYAGKTVQGVFEPEKLNKAAVKRAYNFNSSLLENKGNGSFSLHALPAEAQFSPSYGILVQDFDGDGIQDILLTGNFYEVKPEIGRYDANQGLMLRGRGNLEYEALNHLKTGFFSQGQGRGVKVIQTKQQPLLLVGRNSDSLQVFRWNR